MNSKLINAAFALVLIILIASSFNKQQQENNKYATMRFLEPGMGKGKIVIVYENGNGEEMEIDKYNLTNLGANAVKINEAVNKIASKGYELISASGGDYGSTYIFKKK